MMTETTETRAGDGLSVTAPGTNAPADTARAGEARAILRKLEALRLLLRSAPGAAGDGTSALSGLFVPGTGTADLDRRVAVGTEFDARFDAPLRELSVAVLPPAVEPIRPSHLTARARQNLTRAGGILARLRELTDEPLLAGDDAGPLAVLHRDAAAMVESVLRIIQAFPTPATAQSRLSAGVEAVLAALDARLETLDAVLDQRRREDRLVTTLAGYLEALAAGRPVDRGGLTRLVDVIQAEADDGGPLRWVDPDPAAVGVARWVAGHSLTVARVVARIAGQDPDARDRAGDVVLAGLLHDVGMLDLPLDILAHPGPLTDDQKRRVEQHPRAGAARLMKQPWAEAWLADAVAGHHERPDGTGYPGGVHGGSPVCRLLAVCDTYAALGGARPWRPAGEPRAALTDTLLLAEQGALDPAKAGLLLHLSLYPVGTVVELADGRIGLVVATHPVRRDVNLSSRPVVAVLADESGRPLVLPHHVDLARGDGHAVARSLSADERKRVLSRRYPQWA